MIENCKASMFTVTGRVPGSYAGLVITMCDASIWPDGVRVYPDILIRHSGITVKRRSFNLSFSHEFCNPSPQNILLYDRLRNLTNYFKQTKRHLKDRLCGLVVRVSGYRYRGPGFDPRRYQIFWVVMGLERGPLSLVRSNEELLEWKK